MFVKPANLGSSVGISKAHDAAELEAAFALAAQFDRKIIVERGIEGRELECSVLGNEAPMASLPCEILPSREFYDYEDKYLLDMAQHPGARRPARRSAPTNCAAWPWNAIARWSAKAWRASISCWRTATGKLYINEINTIPGFTSISMYPKMWEHSGIPFGTLLDQLIELALDRHRKKQATRFAR